MPSDQFDHSKTRFYTKATLFLSALSAFGVLALGFITIMNERHVLQRTDYDSKQIALLDTLFMSERSMYNLKKSLAGRLYSEQIEQTDPRLTESIEICAQTLSILPDNCQIKLYAFEPNRRQIQGPQSDTATCTAQDALLGISSLLLFIEKINPEDIKDGGALAWNAEGDMPCLTASRSHFGTNQFYIDIPENAKPIWKHLLGSADWDIDDIIHELIPTICDDIINEFQSTQKSILTKSPHLSTIITSSRIDLIQDINSSD